MWCQHFGIRIASTFGGGGDFPWTRFIAVGAVHAIWIQIYAGQCSNMYIIWYVYDNVSIVESMYNDTV